MRTNFAASRRSPTTTQRKSRFDRAWFHKRLIPWGAERNPESEAVGQELAEIDRDAAACTSRIILQQ